MINSDVERYYNRARLCEFCCIHNHAYISPVERQPQQSREGCIISFVSGQYASKGMEYQSAFASHAVVQRTSAKIPRSSWRWPPSLAGMKSILQSSKKVWKLPVLSKGLDAPTSDHREAPSYAKRVIKREILRLETQSRYWCGTTRKCGQPERCLTMRRVAEFFEQYYD